MANLFSSFDPQTGFKFFSLNWLAISLVWALPSPYWLTLSRLTLMLFTSLTSLKAEFEKLFQPQTSNSLALILASMFVFISFQNLASLLPYVFTGTSHLSITLSLALPLWLGYNLWNFVFNPSSASAHLLPTGTPGLLIPFMIVIELISNFLRPLTLSVRLAANMIAGHLLLILLSLGLPYSNWGVVILGLTGLCLLTVLEIGVSLVQSYVFVTLSSLYIKEINNINN